LTAEARGPRRSTTIGHEVTSDVGRLQTSHAALDKPASLGLELNPTDLGAPSSDDQLPRDVTNVNSVVGSKD